MTEIGIWPWYTAIGQPIVEKKQTIAQATGELLDKDCKYCCCTLQIVERPSSDNRTDTLVNMCSISANSIRLSGIAKISPMLYF